MTEVKQIYEASNKNDFGFQKRSVNPLEEKPQHSSSTQHSHHVEYWMKARAHVLISGRVQGVFFRFETKTEATSRRVTGWVRNLPGGRVEAVFEGERAAVEEMIDFCGKGPPLAKVTGVEVFFGGYTGSFRGFHIKQPPNR